MMKRYSCLMFLMLLLMALGSFSSAAHGQAGSVPDADSAILVALAFTGFNETEGFSPDKIQTPRRIQAEQDTSVTLLHQMINGRSAWQVEFKDVSIGRNASQSSLTDHDRWDVDVFIDGETGSLLKIVCTDGSESRGAPRNPWSDIKLRLPIREGDEPILSGIPTPGSFRDAIRSSNACCWVSTPAEITAYYLVYQPTPRDVGESVDTDSERPIWYIHMKDISIHPFRAEFGVVPVVAYWCFDVATGQPGGCGGFTSGKLETDGN